MSSYTGTKRKRGRPGKTNGSNPYYPLSRTSVQRLNTRENAEAFIDAALQPGPKREYLISLLIEQRMGKSQSNLDFVKAWIPDTLRGRDYPLSTSALVKLAPKNIGPKRIEAACAALVVDGVLVITDEDRWALTEWLGRKTYSCSNCASFWHDPHPPKHKEECPESRVQVISTLKKKGR